MFMLLEINNLQKTFLVKEIKKLIIVIMVTVAINMCGIIAIFVIKIYIG